jgi:transcriptional regulator with XRE-family HTH domain
MPTDQPSDRLAREAAKLVIRARVGKGWTQKELAKAAGTTQPAIARLENADTPPSLSFLERVLAACGQKVYLSSQPNIMVRAYSAAATVTREFA